MEVFGLLLAVALASAAEVQQSYLDIYASSSLYTQGFDLDLYQGPAVLLAPTGEAAGLDVPVDAYYADHGLRSIVDYQSFRPLYEVIRSTPYASGLILPQQGFASNEFILKQIKNFVVPDNFKLYDLLREDNVATVPVIYIAPREVFNSHRFVAINHVARFAVNEYNVDPVPFYVNNVAPVVHPADAHVAAAKPPTTLPPMVTSPTSSLHLTNFAAKPPTTLPPMYTSPSDSSYSSFVAKPPDTLPVMYTSPSYSYYSSFAAKPPTTLPPMFTDPSSDSYYSSFAAKPPTTLPPMFTDPSSDSYYSSFAAKPPTTLPPMFTDPSSDSYYYSFAAKPPTTLPPMFTDPSSDSYYSSFAAKPPTTLPPMFTDPSSDSYYSSFAAKPPTTLPPMFTDPSSDSYYSSFAAKPPTTLPPMFTDPSSNYYAFLNYISQYSYPY